MSDAIKHECGIALLKLKNSLGLMHFPGIERSNVV